MLGEVLGIPAVDLLPIPIPGPLFEELSIPSAHAYLPQFGLGYTLNMVLHAFDSVPHSKQSCLPDAVWAGLHCQHGTACS